MSKQSRGSGRIDPSRAARDCVDSVHVPCSLAAACAGQCTAHGLFRFESAPSDGPLHKRGSAPGWVVQPYSPSHFLRLAPSRRTGLVASGPTSPRMPSRSTTHGPIFRSRGEVAKGKQGRCGGAGLLPIAGVPQQQSSMYCEIGPANRRLLLCVNCPVCLRHDDGCAAV